VLVEKNLADLSKDGRGRAGFRLLLTVSMGQVGWGISTYSCCGPSEDCVVEESEVITGGELIASSSVVSVSGVISLARVKGSLCGSGEISIESFPNAGDEDGIGGVVTPCHLTGGVLAPSVGAWFSIGFFDGFNCLLPRAAAD
jgi:hypothetical protein